MSQVNLPNTNSQHPTINSPIHTPDKISAMAGSNQSSSMGDDNGYSNPNQQYTNPFDEFMVFPEEDTTTVYPFNNGEVVDNVSEAEEDPMAATEPVEDIEFNINRK